MRPRICLYWDSNGRTNLYKFPGRSVPLTPDSLNYGFRSSQTAWDFSTVDNTVNVTPARTINIPLFTRPAASLPCLITQRETQVCCRSGNRKQ